MVNVKFFRSLLEKIIKLIILLLLPWKYIIPEKKENQGIQITVSGILPPLSGILYFVIFILLFMGLGKLFFPLPMYRLAPLPSTIVLDRNGKMLRAFTAPDGMWRFPAGIKDVSPELCIVVLNYEDRWFRFHPGINPLSIIRAALTNIKTGKIVCGGSTITMQVARMMEPKERTIKSKLIEMVRAIQLELSYNKDEILTFYFNMAPYGSNIIGSAAASYFYFNKDQKDLSLGEAALLAAIPNSPTALRPDASAGIREEMRPQALGKLEQKNRVRLARDKVLSRLLQNGRINQEKFEEALAEPVPRQRFSLPFLAPHLALDLKQKYPERYKIVSSIDKNIQTLATNTLQKHLEPLKKHGVSNGAIIVMDTKSREVLAYVGSGDFFDERSSGQVNGAAAPRSPGSALKPFVYALALDRGLLSPESLLSDVPVDYSGYMPENYDEKFRGAVTVEEALTHSLNVPAVRLSARLRDNGIYDFLKNAGITTLTQPEEYYGLSLILGGCEVTLLDLTNLYAGLANMGEFASYKLLFDPGEKERMLFIHTDGAPHLDKSVSRRLLREGTAFILTEMLSEVERPDLPACWESSVNRPKVAWKTGTSYGHKDAWSIGYSPQYTIGVWIGNFNAVGSSAIVGAEAAGPVLFDLFNALNKTSDKQWYVQSAEVRRREVCSLSGMEKSQYCRNSKTEYYIPGVSTNQQCTMHRLFTIDKETNTRLCSHCRIGREYDTKILIIWQPEIATWMERNGVSVDRIPPHYPECSRILAGLAPVIHSPSADCEYIIRDGVDIEYQKILLEASISNDSRNIFWFLDSKMIFNGSPTEKVFITPVPGKHTLICMDDEGRSSEITLMIR